MAKGVVEVEYPECCGLCKFLSEEFDNKLTDRHFLRCTLTDYLCMYEDFDIKKKLICCPIKPLKVEPVEYDYIYKGDGIYERIVRRIPADS